MEDAGAEDAPRERGHVRLPPSDHGYVTADGAVVAADRDTLLRMSLSGQPPAGVWTPETRGVVPTYQVPWIFERLMEPARKNAWGQVQATGFLAALATVVGGVAWFQAPPGTSGGPPLLLVIAVIWFARSLLDHRRLRRMTADDFAAEIEEARRLPGARTGTPVFTRALAAIIGVVAAGQMLSIGSASMDAAGLVKAAVRAGEWWRLFTAPLLHVNPIHLGFNGMALLGLGALVERYANRAYVPLVFLLTALAGGLGSFVYTDGTSVGASGGIMGLVGFALVLSLRRRALLPRSLTQDMLANVVWIAVMGLMAYQYIDNGAHAAGLLAGALLGWLLVPRGGDTPHWEAGPATRVAGWASMGVLAASAAFAVARMFGVV